MDLFSITTKLADSKIFLENQLAGEMKITKMNKHVTWTPTSSNITWTLTAA